MKQTNTGGGHSGTETGLHKGLKIRNFRLLIMAKSVLHEVAPKSHLLADCSSSLPPSTLRENTPAFPELHIPFHFCISSCFYLKYPFLAFLHGRYIYSEKHFSGGISSLKPPLYPLTLVSMSLSQIL